MRKVTVLFFATVSFLLAGCTPSWKVTKPSYKNSEYTIQTPSKWMIIHQGSSTMLSRHGPFLESIRIFSHSLEDSLPHTRLKVHADMLPHEIGETLLYSMMADQQKSHVKMAAQSLEKVDGRIAVRMRIDYQVNDIPCSDLVYAFIVEPSLYQIRYSATKRHYFEESLDEFEKVVKSFRMK